MMAVAASAREGLMWGAGTGGFSVWQNAAMQHSCIMHPVTDLLPSMQLSGVQCQLLLQAQSEGDFNETGGKIFCHRGANLVAALS
jgi:hypothetical protein